MLINGGPSSLSLFRNGHIFFEGINIILLATFFSSSFPSFISLRVTLPLTLYSLHPLGIHSILEYFVPHVPLPLTALTSPPSIILLFSLPHSPHSLIHHYPHSLIPSPNILSSSIHHIHSSTFPSSTHSFILLTQSLSFPSSTIVARLSYAIPYSYRLSI